MIHISNIIYWPYNIVKGNHCHSETNASVDGASGILDPASRIFSKTSNLQQVLNYT